MYVNTFNAHNILCVKNYQTHFIDEEQVQRVKRIDQGQKARKWYRIKSRESDSGVCAFNF